MAAAAKGAPVVAPDTYFTKYSASDDTLDGEYMPLYASHAVTSTSSPESLLNRLADSSELIPKVFLVQVMDPERKPVILTVFRITKYVPHPIRASFWDDKVFAFTGDVEVNNFINIMEVEAEAFERTERGNVHTLATINAAIAAQPGAEMLDAIPDGAAGSESIRSRYMVQVPHAYIPLVFNKVLSPVKAWETLGVAILNDSNEIACDHVLDWLRLSMTKHPGATTGADSEPPATYFGDVTTAFPTLAVDSSLNGFRWNMLRTDLPVLDRSGCATAEPMLHVLREMRDERKEQMQREEERRVLSKADKLPSEAFPTTAKKWMRLATVDRERDLPDIFHLSSICLKHERRQVFADQVAERATQDGAATRFEPVISKELFEKVFHGNVGPASHQIEDLSLGLQPFALGNYIGAPLGDAIQSRAEQYDLMVAGSTAPTLGEQYTFSTKEIQLPSDVYTAGLMLKTTSVVLDVVQGVANQNASRFRYFCRSEWPEMEATLHMAGTETPGLLAAVLPRIMRWVQIRLVRYFHQRMVSVHPPNPRPTGNLWTLCLIEIGTSCQPYRIGTR